MEYSTKQTLLVNTAVRAEEFGIEAGVVGRILVLFFGHVAGYGQAFGRDTELLFAGDVILAGGSLTNGEDTRIGILHAFVSLERLVLQLGTKSPAQGLILHGLVLVQHADDTGMGKGGDAEQIANDGLRLGIVVDIADDIAYAVKDNEVGLMDEYGGLDQPESLL